MSVSPCFLSASYALNPFSRNNPLEIISDHLTKGSSEGDIPTKREIYQKAFEVLQKADESDSKQLQEKLFELFELYASQTCYAQGTYGFQKCAYLLEASLLLQFDALHLLSYASYWKTFESIESFISSLKDKTDNFEELTANLGTINPDVLVQDSSNANLRDLMAKTMIKLNYSYQNIQTMRDKGFQFHQHLDVLTEKLIGSDTIEQKRELAMYSYNRCSFLADLESPGNTEAKLNSYNRVIQLLKESYEPNDPARLSREAQISNIKGLITLRSADQKNFEEMAAIRKVALPFFRTAFDIRSELIKQYPEGSKEEYDQEFLLSNIRTALVDYLVHIEQPTADDLKELQGHKQALEAYIVKMEARGDAHMYAASYRTALTKIK